jgi:CubicO group peptidase (beta-lactamase class C family)
MSLVFAKTYKIENKIEIIMNIQALLQEYVDNNNAVGASIGLIDHGTITTFSYGKKSIDKDEAVSENTIFEIGSITKVFTTLALMDMVTKGSFQLDDPIELHLPGVKVPEMDGKKITLRHLATHHSGLPSMPTNFNPKNSLNPFEDYSMENLYEFLNHYNLIRAPGVQFEYSNVGMGLLGSILCLKTGKKYEQLILDSISKKLGMQNTGISLTQETLKEFAKGHHLGKIAEYWDFTQAMAGAGALRSNVKDMTQFLATNMGFLNSYVNNLLKGCHSQQYSAGSGINIGLGWLLSHSDHADIIWHNGGTGGFRSFLGFNPETKKGVVILSNSTEGWTEQLGLSLLDPESYKKPVVDGMLGKDLDYLKRFEGTYEIITKDQPITEIKLKLSESKLIYVVPTGELQLIPESLCIFSLKGVAGQKLQFILDDNGKVIKAQMLAFPSNKVVTEILRNPQKG